MILKIYNIVAISIPAKAIFICWLLYRIEQGLHAFLKLAFFFVKVHDIEAIGLFGSSIWNTKVKPVSMAVSSRIHVDVEVILKLIDLYRLHQIATFKPTLKYECLILLVFKLIKLWQFWIKPIKLGTIGCTIIIHTFFGAIAHHPLGFVNVSTSPILWCLIRIINQHLFSYQRTQMVSQVFDQDILVFKTKILCKRLNFWALLVVIWSICKKWLIYACFGQWFVDESYWNVLVLTWAHGVELSWVLLSLGWLRVIGLPVGVLTNWAGWFLLILCFVLYRRLWLSFLEFALMTVLRHSQTFLVLIKLIVEIVRILIS